MATGDSCDPNTAVIHKYHSCHTRKWLCLLASVISQHHHQEFQNLKDLMVITILPGHDIKRTTFYKLSLKVYTYNKHNLTKYILWTVSYKTLVFCTKSPKQTTSILRYSNSSRIAYLPIWCIFREMYLNHFKLSIRFTSLLVRQAIV